MILQFLILTVSQIYTENMIAGSLSSAQSMTGNKTPHFKVTIVAIT